MTTISFINQKGGCGKSSACVHLAGAFAARGQSVLLIDADPQGSVTQAFIGSAEFEQLPRRSTLAAMFDPDMFVSDPLSVLQLTKIPGVALVPANQELAQFNAPTPEAAGLEQFVIRDIVDAASEYDFILIDCPPNLYACSWSAMIASDYVVIPVPPEDFGTQGLRAVHQAVERAQMLNPGLRRLGHLIARRDNRLVIHRAYERRLRELYQALVLETVIPEANAFKVALAARQPVEFHAPRSDAARSMRQLANEISTHIEVRRRKQVA